MTTPDDTAEYEAALLLLARVLVRAELAPGRGVPLADLLADVSSSLGYVIRSQEDCPPHWRDTRGAE